MLIGVNAPFYLPNRVGVTVVIENLVAELSREWNLVIYTSLPEAFAALPVSVRPIPEWTRKQRPRLWWENAMLPRLLARDHVDVLLSPFSELPFGLRIPSIAVVHDITPLVLPGSATPFYTLLFRLTLNSLRQASRIVTVSDCTRRDLIRLPAFRNRRVDVIYNGSRYSSQAPMPRPEVLDEMEIARPYVLYVGGFLPHKNTELLVQAFRELIRDFPHQLVMVGWAHPARIKEIHALSQDPALVGRLKVLSGIPEPALAALYSGCDLFIYPSLYEGFGLPVLEAMGCGAPVLCSNTSSLPEVGGDAVAYFSPDSKADLLGQMRALLGDAQARRVLSEKGLTRARQFTWRRTADSFSRMIKDVTGQSPPLPLPAEESSQQPAAARSNAPVAGQDRDR